LFYNIEGVTLFSDFFIRVDLYNPCYLCSIQKVQGSSGSRFQVSGFRFQVSQVSQVSQLSVKFQEFFEMLKQFQGFSFIKCCYFSKSCVVFSARGFCFTTGGGE